MGGAALSAGAGVVNAVAGTAQAGWNASGLGGLWDRGVASAGGWLNDGVNGIYNPPR